MKAVICGARYVQDLPDQFYFSTPPGYGGHKPEIGETVCIISEPTGNLLALSEIKTLGDPREECSTVKLKQRFL